MRSMYSYDEYAEYLTATGALHDVLDACYNADSLTERGLVLAMEGYARDAGITLIDLDGWDVKSFLQEVKDEYEL